MTRITFITAIALMLAAGSTYAHSGGLDKNGCHTNRSTGEYHCHRGPNAGASRQAVPRQSLQGAGAGRGTAPRDRPFANCAEARAAGAAPVLRGEPGYGPHLDRDNDGVGCEPYRGR